MFGSLNKEKPHRGSKVSRTIVLWICALLVVIEIIILIPSTLNYKATLRNNIIHFAEDSLKHLAFSLYINAEIPALSAGIVAVNVYSDEGSLVYKWRRAEAPTWLSLPFEPFLTILQNETIQLEERYRFGEADYLIRAQMETSTVQSELIAYVKRIASLVLLIVLTVVVGTWLVLRSTVVKPLIRITDALKNPNSEEVLKWDRDDEFGELISSYNAMRSNLYKAEQHTKNKQQQLEFMAYNDVLTDLPNRRALLEKLSTLDCDTPTVIYVIELGRP